MMFAILADVEDEIVEQTKLLTFLNALLKLFFVHGRHGVDELIFLPALNLKVQFSQAKKAKEQDTRIDGVYFLFHVDLTIVL